MFRSVPSANTPRKQPLFANALLTIGALLLGTAIAGSVLCGCARQEETVSAREIRVTIRLMKQSVFRFALQGPQGQPVDVHALEKSLRSGLLPDLEIEAISTDEIVAKSYAVDEAELDSQGEFIAGKLQELVGRVEEVERRLVPVTEGELKRTQEIIAEQVELLESWADFEIQIRSRPPDVLEITSSQGKEARKGEDIAYLIVPPRGLVEIRHIPKLYRCRSTVADAQSGKEAYTFERISPSKGESDRVAAREVLEEAPVVFTGEDIRGPVGVVLNPGEPEELSVQFRLRASAGERFADFSEKHVGESLVIVRDGKVVGSGVIHEHMPTGYILIKFDPKKSDAMRRAQRLRAHRLRSHLEAKPLPLPLVVEVNGRRVSLDE